MRPSPFRAWKSKTTRRNLMLARKACFALLLSFTVLTLTAPAFAKYTEEWIGSGNVTRPQTAPRASDKATSASSAAASRAPSQPGRPKAPLTASPFDKDPIAAYADDPIAEFARPRTKRNHL
ncbi:hypothetical protein [Caballeronia sp. SL2Y3]|uniref:hypothetical protein n=1 Tax=Caballeronia sp. SL2Y3 TaxID=2878151 RepID=UPI001FD35BF4|nr:hypothetical protein [Caballeronia sp. SL2Y3]